MAPSAVSPTSTPILNGQSNGHQSNGHSFHNLSKPSIFASPTDDDLLDLICVGFGPASLAIAIALQDACTSSLRSKAPPKVLFLEKQPQFAWHAGMQIPGAKMQISFLKDLATPRDPRSQFTFLNYLHQKGRLNQFINLGTFLPSRLEYEDYLRWCAGHFDDVVRYGQEVEGVNAGETSDDDGKVNSFVITARDGNGELIKRKARHVVIAVGGQGVIPLALRGLKNVVHSSQYATAIGQIAERERGRKLRFAVVGSGQSAAEIFSDLWDRFPDAEVRLVIKGASLRPSDDSPFVNEIFDPDRVDGVYYKNASDRAAAIALDRGTNYGVVRLELLEHLYDRLYMQRLRQPDEKLWRCRIIPERAVTSARQSDDSSVILKIADPDQKRQEQKDEEDEMTVDYVFTATGYVRNAHESMLAEIKNLLPQDLVAGKVNVGRNYRVLYDADKVDETKAGVWLQGCNESTHGLSDTLLSILAIRGGELVHSIFGEELSK